MRKHKHKFFGLCLLLTVGGLGLWGQRQPIVEEVTIVKPEIKVPEQKVAPEVTKPKLRPKSGNAWVVGESAEADFNILGQALEHVRDGDKIYLEKGHQCTNWTSIEHSIEIEGRGDVTLDNAFGGVINLKRLVLKNLTVNFGISYGGGLTFKGKDAQIILDGVTFVGGKEKGAHLKVEDGVRLKIENSKFLQTSIWVSDDASAEIRNSSIENYEELIRLTDRASVYMASSYLSRFSKRAITISSDEVKFTGVNIEGTNGHTVLYSYLQDAGKHIKMSNSSFAALKGHIVDPILNVECENCLYDDIGVTRTVSGQKVGE